MHRWGEYLHAVINRVLLLIAKIL